jgi:hypothetical protein
MKKNRFYLMICSFVLIAWSCDIDNYDSPNGTIYGVLTDNITNQPLQTEQPNGFSIKLFEKGGKMNSPIIFYGKPDGSFKNAWIFQNEYKVIPSEGAFFPVDTVSVNVGKSSEVNFTVTPFLAVLDFSAQGAAGKVISNYKIGRSEIGGKILERKTLVSSIPTINNSIFNAKTETNLSGIQDDVILSSSFSDEVTGLEPGEYYVRVAVRTDNTLNRYNYSEPVKVSVQ